MPHLPENATTFVGQASQPQDDRVATAFVDHYAEVSRHLTRMLRDEELAADLTQLTFERLVRTAQAGEMPDNVRAWLFRVATNAAISDRRRARRWTMVVDRLPRPDVDDDPETILVRAETTADVRTMLTNLSADQRRALLMAAHGFSGRQIATALGRTDTSTRTLMCRVRSQLRERAGAVAVAA